MALLPTNSRNMNSSKDNYKTEESSDLPTEIETISISSPSSGASWGDRVNKIHIVPMTYKRSEVTHAAMTNNRVLRK